MDVLNNGNQFGLRRGYCRMALRTSFYYVGEAVCWFAIPRDISGGGVYVQLYLFAAFCITQSDSLR